MVAQKQPAVVDAKATQAKGEYAQSGSPLDGTAVASQEVVAQKQPAVVDAKATQTKGEYAQSGSPLGGTAVASQEVVAQQQPTVGAKATQTSGEYAQSGSPLGGTSVAGQKVVAAPVVEKMGKKSMTVTNRLGNTHGLVVEEERTVLSGGAHSTVLELNDDGASFANMQTGAPVVVSGVAAGVAPTDAANVAQVHGVVDAAVAPLNGRLDGVERGLQRLDQKIDAVEKKLSGGVAMALALSQPVSFAPQSQSAVTGGVATYNGQTAMGFSFNRLLTNTEARRTVVSLGVATTMSGRPSASARIGASFSW